MSKINYANKVALNIDPSVAAINKCQADDMNSIKNAINQGGSFTPLTINTNTGVFYCSLEGTLATNDIVKVNVPTTIGNATWYVSVDNDTTNYVVLYEDGTNVKPVDVSDKNVELYFNGTNFVLIGSGVENSYSTSTTKPYSCDYVNTVIKEIYSTNEIKTNGIWIDGKPIYRIVFNGSKGAAGSTITVGNVSSLNIDTLINMSLFSSGSDPLSAQYYNTNSDFARVYIDGSANVRLSSGSNYPRVPFTYNVVIEYTKNTN